VLGIAWGLGTICGSIAGGLLAQPAKKMPSLFGQTLFETFPYLLPNVVSAAMLLLGLIATIVFLKEPERAQKSTNPGVGSESVLKLIWREKQIMLTIAMYVCCGAINTFCKETNPLFFVASLDHGGLNFGTRCFVVVVVVVAVHHLTSY
jgi:Na+/melibiose symporter-like transporter